MIPVDGFPRGRAAVADSHAALKHGATDGTANVKGGAAFDGVLLEVSKREAAIDAPSPFDAAAPTPVRGTFAVGAGLVSSSDGAAPVPLASLVADTSLATSRGDDVAKPIAAASGLASQTAAPRA